MVFKYLFMKVLLAMFFIIFGVSFVKCLAGIAIILCIAVILGIVMVLNWMWTKICEVFT